MNTKNQRKTSNGNSQTWEAKKASREDSNQKDESLRPGISSRLHECNATKERLKETHLLHSFTEQIVHVAGSQIFVQFGIERT